MKKILTTTFLFVICTLLNSQETMKFVYFNDFAPFSWEEKGKMKGLLIDIVDEALNKRMGLKVSHAGFPWERAQRMVKQQQADAFITVPTPTRRNYTQISTESVLDIKIHLYTQSTNPKIEEYKKFIKLSDLKEITIGDYVGNGWAQKNLKDLNVYWVDSFQTALHMLAKNRFNAIIGLSNVTQYNLKQLELQNKIIMLPQIFDTSTFNLCIGKKSSFRSILKQFDKVIKSMKEDGSIKKICEKYY